MLDQDKRYSDKKKKKNATTMYSTLSRSFPRLFLFLFLRLVVIYEDILVLYWFGQVLFESVI